MVRTLEIVTLRDYLGYALLGLACGLAGTTIGLTATRPHVTPAPIITLPLAPDAARVAEQVPVREDSPPPPSSDVHFVFDADGATYVAIEELDSERLPRHGKARVVKTDYVGAEAIATVTGANLSAAQRAWAHREVIVDSSCRATISGFAIISRINGDPGWVSESGAAVDHWTSASLFAHGRVELAGKLDRCTGTYARDAAAPQVTVFDDVTDVPHAKAATDALIASQLGAAAVTEWKQSEQHGHWFDETRATMSRVVRDPRSGVTWISTHGHVDFTCGGPDINIWGLFRVERDGTLTTVQLRQLDELVEITKLVDVDGDGVPELIGTTWLGPTTLLTTAGGTELGRLEVRFLGCPC